MSRDALVVTGGLASAVGTVLRGAAVVPAQAADGGTGGGPAASGENETMGEESTNGDGTENRSGSMGYESTGRGPADETDMGTKTQTGANGMASDGSNGDAAESDGQPGVGLVVALVVILAVTALGLRRGGGGDDA